MELHVILIASLVAMASSLPQQGGYGYQTPSSQPARPPANIYNQPQHRPNIPSNSYAAPTNQQPTQTRPAPSQGGSNQMPYQFDWGVNDADSGNSFSHVESNDGSVTRGEYRVLLPDGRTQVVKFFDDGNGYNAEVTYE